MSGLKAVLLAAGAARRFGGSKLTQPWRGRPLIAGALDCALAAPVDEVAAVTGTHAEAVERAMAALQPRALAAGRLRLVRCAASVEGMAASLRAGVAALGEVEGVFVFLGDMPAVPPDLPHAMAERLRAGALAVAPTWRGRRGHPVLFGRALLPRLLDADGDEGGRQALAGLGEGLALVPSPDPGVLFDVDTPGDLEMAALETGGLEAEDPATGRADRGAG